jgi:hypothetical protein
MGKLFHQSFTTFVFLSSFFLIFLIYPHTTFSQDVGQFCCIYEGPERQPCVVNVNTENHCDDPQEGSPEQEFCAQYNQDEDVCNSQCSYCSYPTPTPGGLPECWKLTYDPYGGKYSCVTVPGDERPADGSCPTGSVYYSSRSECEGNINNPNPSDGPPPTLQICDTIPTTQPTQQAICRDCLTVKGGIYTAVGCLPTTSEGFTGAVLTLALSIGGGVALLLMVYGGFLFATAGGNPEAAQKGKEVFMGAIIGLLFIIFSVTLLNVIGVDILQLPGL